MGQYYSRSPPKHHDDFTAQVVDSFGPQTSPRLRVVMAALVTHAHAFAREVDLTSSELLAAIDMVNWAGRMSNAQRNETQLLCDVLGIESLTDEITSALAARCTTSVTATPSAILGPFWRADAPRRDHGSSMMLKPVPDAQAVFLHGRVTAGGAQGTALADATVDIWQASTNGLYEQQDPDQPEHNLRGVFTTDAEGRYALYCIRPTAYPIPDDGPAGKLLHLLDRDVYRPAHIHFMVRAQGYKTLVTQIFDNECAHLHQDSVFAVKNELAMRFVPRQGDPEAELELEFNIALEKA